MNKILAKVIKSYIQYLHAHRRTYKKQGESVQTSTDFKLSVRTQKIGLSITLAILTLFQQFGQ